MSNPAAAVRAPVRWAARWWAAMCITSALGMGWSPYATAQDEAKPSRQAFRVCQDPNNLPFSNVGGDGIENRIAELFAKELGLPVTYYSFPQRLAFIRNTLRYKLPGEDFRCDIVMGVPAGYDQVSATKPYYHSTYALVIAKGRGLDRVKTIDDFLAVDRAQLEKLRIGLYDRTPASDWLVKHQLLDQATAHLRIDIACQGLAAQHAPVEQGQRPVGEGGLVHRLGHLLQLRRRPAAGIERLAALQLTLTIALSCAINGRYAKTNVRGSGSQRLAENRSKANHR